MYQTLWIAAQAVLIGKFIALNSYIRKEESLKISDLNICFMVLKKSESWLFEKGNKIDKTLVRIIKKKDKAQKC